MQGGASAGEVKAKVVGSTLDGKGEFSVLAVWSCSNGKKHPLVLGKVFLVSLSPEDTDAAGCLVAKMSK